MISKNYKYIPQIPFSFKFSKASKKEASSQQFETKMLSNVKMGDFPQNFKMDLQETILKNSLQYQFQDVSQIPVRKSNIDLAYSVITHWKKSQKVPPRLSDRKGAILSMIVLANLKSIYTVNSSIDIEWKDQEQMIEYRGRAEYVLRQQGNFIPVFEARKFEMKKTISATSLYAKSYCMNNDEYKNCFAIATNLFFWNFIHYDKAKDSLEFYHINLVDPNICNVGMDRIKHLLQVINRFTTLSM